MILLGFLPRRRQSHFLDGQLFGDAEFSEKRPEIVPNFPTGTAGIVGRRRPESVRPFGRMFQARPTSNYALGAQIWPH